MNNTADREQENTPKPRTPSWGVTAIVVVANIWAVWYGLSIAFHPYEEPESLYLIGPLIVLLIGAGFIVLWSEWRRHIPTSAVTEKWTRPNLYLMVSLLILLGGIWLLGMPLAVACYIVVFSWLLGERSLSTLVVLAAVTVSVTIFGFINALGVPMPLVPFWGIG